MVTEFTDEELEKILAPALAAAQAAKKLSMSETLFNSIYRDFLVDGWDVVRPSNPLVSGWRRFVRKEYDFDISSSDLNTMLCDRIADRAAQNGLL